jgi:GrpB-like predicted nucleotidyltransferase (UPF0157 family)
VGHDRSGLQPAGIWRDHRPPNAEGPEAQWEKLYFRPANPHVRVLWRDNQRYALMVRDYLRTHAATAEACAELKRRRVEHIAYPADYPEVKDPAVDLICPAARTGYRPGEADV